MAIFPTHDWVDALMIKLNNDEQYAQIAQKWEGDMIFVVEPGGDFNETITFYLDLWHGACRNAYPIAADQEAKAVLTLKAPYNNYVRLLKGELEPMPALLTRKISVQGNMTIIMKNVPTVLDFVRCCREITDGFSDHFV